MANFTTKIKNEAWSYLTFAIKDQLTRTPREYDLPALADRIARQTADKYTVDYLKVLNYLEDRYKKE